MYFINVLPPEDHDRDQLRKQVSESVALGFRHTLVTVNHRRLDPWATAQAGLEMDPHFSPLIALNPAYEHPVALAKKAITLLGFYGPRLALNFVGGSFVSEMKSVGDTLDFEDRHTRLRESLAIVEELLATGRVASFEGRFFKANRLEISPLTSHAGEIEFYLAGALAETVGPAPHRRYVKNMRPLEQTPAKVDASFGLHLGLCVRPTRDEALEASQALFPEDRRGAILQAMARANEAGGWNQWLDEHLKTHEARDPMFDLGPLLNSQASSPFLVGSYDDIAKRLREYQARGYGFAIVDYARGDGEHTAACLERITP